MHSYSVWTTLTQSDKEYKHSHCSRIQKYVYSHKIFAINVTTQSASVTTYLQLEMCHHMQLYTVSATIRLQRYQE